MARRKTNPDFVTGVPELLILRLLSRTPMHGYAVVQSIKVQSGGKLKFGEGSIYPILHRLEADGMLSTNTSEVNGRKRVTYSVTENGLRRLADSQSAWNQVVQSVRTILNGDSDENRAVA